jgi:carboxyl-terminal processing protease
MQNRNSRFRGLGFTLWFWVFSFGLLALPLRTCAEAGKSEITSKSKSASSQVVADTTAQIEQICSAIYKGDFGAARELLGGSSQPEDAAIVKLADITSAFKVIGEKRELARQAAYQKQLAKLEKYRAAADSGVQGHVPSDPNEQRPDINDIPKVLSVIASVADFADEQQKKLLLSDSFVKQIIQKAKGQAEDHDSKGKWLDAYTDCYWWLLAIDPDNKEYSSYGEQLLEKANIVSSFQDSPCETRTERYEKVEKQMFERAIDVVNFNYVNTVDYSQMATKAVKRCESLAQVIKTSEVVRDALGVELDEQQDDKRFSAWSAALTAILDEVNQAPSGISKDKFIDVFGKVLDLNTATLELSQGMLIAEFAEAALDALDPYTNMVWPREVKDFERTMTNEFTGIGIEISKRKGLLTVISLLPDTPAYNSGLDAGDVIEAVDGAQTKGMTLMCAVRRITGPAGTKVELTIRRDGEDQTRDITITRARITVPTIRGWQRTEAGKWLNFVDDEEKIGYVRITSFAEKTASDLGKTLSELEAEDLKGLILDLRFNTGGLLSSAIDVTDIFVEEGPIVSTRPRFAWTYASAKKKNTHPNYPLVVLTNRFSASASEIVAGALQDEVHSRAVLVGERTQGKGSVQGITRYPDGGAQLKYTMAYYHLPSGQRVETRETMKKQGRKDWGVGPNIELNLTSEELEKLYNVQRHNNVLVRAGHEDTGALTVTRHTLEETLAADHHLAVGLLVVRSKLVQEEATSKKL